MKYAVIDKYDGGTGKTVVSKHRRMEAAEKACSKLNRQTRAANGPNTLAKYGVAQMDEYGNVISIGYTGW